MSRYKVDICGINTSTLKALTNKENYELFIKMKAGDPFARDDLIKSMVNNYKLFDKSDEGNGINDRRCRSTRSTSSSCEICERFSCNNG